VEQIIWRLIGRLRKICRYGDHPQTEIDRILPVAMRFCFSKRILEYPKYNKIAPFSPGAGSEIKVF
jgi:hypothetical protein